MSAIKPKFSENAHVCQGDHFSSGTGVPHDAEVATGDLPLALHRIPGTTAIEAKIGYACVLLTGPQVAKFWEMVEQVRQDLPHHLREK